MDPRIQNERSYVTLRLDLVFVARLHHGKLLERHVYIWVLFRVSYLYTTGACREHPVPRPAHVWMLFKILVHTWEDCVKRINVEDA